MGLTDLGYVRRTYDDILNDKIQRAKELFGEDIETSELTPLGKFIRINAYDQALLEEEIEKVYYARFPNTASGQSLDRLLPFAGITRNPATPARFSVQITGTPGFVVPVGFLIGTEAGVNFYTVSDVEIGEDGACVVSACCTVAGVIGNVGAGNICSIVNPNASVTGVAGLSCEKAGEDEESDADLRVRFAGTVQGSGSCNENALRSALLRIPGVKYAAVIVNGEDTTDSSGRPPHSFECYVQGGDGREQEIAETIFEKKPVGIKTYGDITKTVIDASGIQQSIRYSPAQKVAVKIKTAIVTDNAYESNGAAVIQTNVTEYINSLGIGKKLVLSTIYEYIYRVPGVKEVTSLQASTDDGANYTTENVTVTQYGLVVCSGVSVEVT